MIIAIDPLIVYS